MNPKWKKITLITAPILIAGSVYAFTNASASNEDNGITGTLVSSEKLTPEEIAALESAKPAPAPATGTDTTPEVDMSAINPFTVYTPPAAPAATTPAAAPAVETSQQPFSLDNVKKLELKSQTTLGELKLEFKSDKGELQLKGEIADRKIEVKGEQALDVLGKLLASFGLQDSMTALLQGEDVKLDAALAGALKGLEIELNDGRKIETKAPGKNPKAQGKHDNGNHYGWDKAKKEKENKGKGNEKAKGKDKHDNDDQGEDN
ncbi:hypothetical protein EV586_104150 [Tumebacillus sp. BK434]|uniref:hypothetical protein n=1 Tax=Tumebacillus sp. BK434 TaxID=2512169 RepID=UPI00104E5446|nr:hypothetical protein [Tumebacillus sp. BK434]TCP54531.1 hypothetical protein EV586_104150 [Tumebacillus sp. BK434]